jgi:hypothetical protein
MDRAAPENMRALLSHLDENEFAAAYERLQRYARFALEVTRDSNDTLDLTTSAGSGSLDTGQVDPSTFQNTG